MVLALGKLYPRAVTVGVTRTPFLMWKFEMVDETASPFT
jgi:hypothetical protein